MRGLVFRRLCTGAMAACLAACAASPDRFYSNRYSLGDTRLCRTFDKADLTPDATFAADVQAEMARRGLSPQRCEQLEHHQNVAIGAAAVVTAVAVVALHDSHKNGGGPNVFVVPDPIYVQGWERDRTVDREWDWDQFYRGSELVWECRGVQTGQVAPAFHCDGMPMTDARWPAK